MATLDAMQRRIGSAKDLYAVVRVMKALASANIRQCEKSVESITLYNETIESGFQALMRHASHLVSKDVEVSGTTRTCVVLCGSDQGMCGPFNENITSYALREMKERTLPLDNTPVIAVGIRLIGRLEDAGARIHASFSLPSSISAVTDLVRELFTSIDELRTERGISQFLVVNHRPNSIATFEPSTRKLLPIDPSYLKSLAARPWKSSSLPMFNMDWRSLFSVLVRQYLYAMLHRSLAESMASENSSRLASMQAAEKNIEEHLGKLQFAYHQKRQQTITEELLDIVAGFEAMSEEEPAT